MIDEISLDKEYYSREVSKQEQLIAKHFGDIKKRIRSAGSREQAVEISEEVLHDFECECISEIIPDFLKHYLSTLIDKYW